MKKLLILLFSLFFLSAPSVFADDISDFQIEGISIGDSLLDYMTEEEILKWIEKTKDAYSYLKEPNKYSEVYLTKDFPTYNGGVSFFIKNNTSNQYITNKNEKYRILFIRGKIDYVEDFDNCIAKRNEVAEVLSGMFPNEKKEEWSADYAPDTSGNSVVVAVKFLFKAGAKIEVQCINMEETFRSKNNWSEGLFVSIYSKETIEWLNDYK